MRYREGWEETAEHWAALWRGEALDRPCLCVTAPRPAGAPGPPAPRTPEEQWLDPAWVMANLRAHLANTAWLGEAIPSYLLQGGWVACYGATPRFSFATIWHDPIAVDWDAPPEFAPATAAPWVARLETLYRAVLAEAGWDGFLVGRPCLLPGNDLLAGILGPEPFLTSLYDRPAWMREAILTLARNQVALLRHFAAIAGAVHAFPYGNAGWMPFWVPEEYISTQSDVSCMLAPEMYDEFILPELDLLGREFGAVWYHLDGHHAGQHLPRLCSLPYLRVIQYTPAPDEPPNGPEHLPLYRTIQRAGKIVHIQLPAQHVEPLVRALDPALLVLDTWAETPADAEALLADAVRWTRG